MTPPWLTHLELVLAIVMVVWLQVVGVTVRQVLAHVFEALPLLVLVLLPREPWVRLTAVLAGFCWIIMLTIFIPEVQTELRQAAGLPRFLAPVMVALAAISMAVNLSILGGSVSKLWLFIPLCLALIPLMVLISPYAMKLLTLPLVNFMSGKYVWAGALVLELVLILAAPYLLICAVTQAEEIRLSVLPWGKLALYWLGFLVCMIVSQLPAINPSTR